MTKTHLQKYLPLKRESALRGGIHADELAAIESAVDSLDHPTERLLLRLRYINGYSWTRVARAIHYSRAQTMRIHGRALRHLTEADGFPPES